MNSDSS